MQIYAQLAAKLTFLEKRKAGNRALWKKYGVEQGDQGTVLPKLVTVGSFNARTDIEVAYMPGDVFISESNS